MTNARATRFGRKLDLAQGHIDMTHGAGGRATAHLVEELFAAAFSNPALDQRDDYAVIDPPPGQLAFSTDSFVVSPIFFPGGDIGSLAVNGTVNDVAMSGAKPLWLTAGFILEEGLPLADLARVVRSMAAAAQAAGVRVIAGDTKVVERGKGDGIFINTAGCGVVRDGLALSGAAARPGDRLLISGTLGDHGIAIMAARGDLGFTCDVVSDCAPLNGLIDAVLDAAPGVRCLRDPTRGGLGATVNEIADQSGVGVQLDEAALPVRPAVAAACEVLGVDPLYVANEGKLLVVCPPEQTDAALAAMRAHPLGVDAAIIGQVVDDPQRFVTLRTAFGGKRLVDWLNGDQLPRIC